MQLAAAFAHKASIEAMKESARLDPKCVLCAWGYAWASGPTINYTVEGDDLVAVQRLAAEADKLARRRGTKFERDMTLTHSRTGKKIRLSN